MKIVDFVTGRRERNAKFEQIPVFAAKSAEIRIGAARWMVRASDAAVRQTNRSGTDACISFDTIPGLPGDIVWVVMCGNEVIEQIYWTESRDVGEQPPFGERTVQMPEAPPQRGERGETLAAAFSKVLSD